MLYNVLEGKKSFSSLFISMIFSQQRLKDESRWSKSFYCYICASECRSWLSFNAFCLSLYCSNKWSENFSKSCERWGEIIAKTNESRRIIRAKTGKEFILRGDIITIHLVGIFKKISCICVNGSYSNIRNALPVDSLTLMWTTNITKNVTVYSGKLCDNTRSFIDWFLVVDKYGQDSKDDSKLRPIVCFIEGAIHHILLHLDDAQNVGYSVVVPMNWLNEIF